MSASMDAGDVVDLLNDYFSLLVEVIFKFDGTIDKFVGDAILAVFGSPEPDPDQCEKAVQAAIAMQAAMRAANTRADGRPSGHLRDRHRRPLRGSDPRLRGLPGAYGVHRDRGRRQSGHPLLRCSAGGGDPDQPRDPRAGLEERAG